MAFTRELRDRWLEEVNSGRYVPCSRSKYDVCRLIGDEAMIDAMPVKQMTGETPVPPEQKLLAA